MRMDRPRIPKAASEHAQLAADLAARAWQVTGLRLEEDPAAWFDHRVGTLIRGNVIIDWQWDISISL
eukprot:4914262-Heterocapsa_arctica.AAC.1